MWKWKKILSHTFTACTSLKTIPIVPESVSNISYAFYGCSSLTGQLVINANSLSGWEPYGACLQNAATNNDCNLVLSGTSTYLQQIYDTKSSNSHITLNN